MWRNKPWIFQVEGGASGGAAGEGSGDGGDGGDKSEGAGDEGKAPAFKPISSQEELNSIISERVSRERSKYKDYNDLKRKAAAFDQAEEANKSELQKATEARQKLEKDLEAANVALLRRDVAVAHGITDADDIELFLTGTDKATLDKQAKRLSERNPVKKGNRVSREGTNPSASGSESEERAAVQSLFG